MKGTTLLLRPLPRLSRPPGVALLLALCALALLPVQGMAHLGLQRSSPAAGDTVRVVPERIRLTFTQRVELSVARVALAGPHGERVLEPLALAPDSPRVLVAPVGAPLAAGRYTVLWQVVGPDGHPIRGDFHFTVPEDAQGVAPAPAPDAAPPTPVEEARRPEPAQLDAQSPLYAAVRWGGFVALLALIGAVAFRLLLLPRVAGALAAEAAPAAARLGAGAAALLLGILLLRLYVQSLALFGAPDAGRVRALLLGTDWGWGWLLQAAGALVALIGLLLARRAGHIGWALAAVGVLVVALTSGMSGHAAGVERLRTAALLADGAHVLGAGGWLGTLLVLLAVGLPAARRVGADARSGAAALVEAFSPLALGFATLVVGTGLFAAWLHLGTLPALLRSEYGQTLLGKLALLSVVFGTGWYNWRRVRPALREETAARRFRRSGAVELLAGALVLAATAYLVATPPPAERETPPPAAGAP